MRIRTIKPEFFLHEQLFDLERSSKLPIRVGFAGLWCAADREGRFRWEPRKLKAQIVPYDEVDFSRVLDALTTRGFLVRYASGGVNYGYIPSFKKHQFVNPREVPSLIPPPMDLEQVIAIQGIDACVTRDSRVNDACSTLPSCSLPNTVPVPLPVPGESEGGGTEILCFEQVRAALMTCGIPDDFVHWVYDDWVGRQGRDGAGVGVEVVGYVRKRWAREQTEWRAGTHKGRQKTEGTSQPAHRAESRAREYPQTIKAKRL